MEKSMVSRTGSRTDDGPTPGQVEQAAAILDMLSTPMRLHLMWLLCHGDHDVGWLAENVGATVAAVSQQLGKLRLAGLVSSRRQGRYQIYTVDDPDMLVLIDQVFAQVATDRPHTPDQRSPGASFAVDHVVAAGY
ncbi:metalloregulator ArsR/SmtB family transcription factor [Dactylosporangium sp. NPDC051485]|uniref:ArsR/SmtB family transcription factor n=1 Tax=Dactylosporangium sp. NPDC051485 TaxID=3154846 RepID=UPI0034354B60